MPTIIISTLAPNRPVRFKRRCPCVKAYDKPSYRWVNIVSKCGVEAPMCLAAPNEWALLECPQCHGTGLIEEEATGRIDVEAMKRDFERKIACR